MNHALVAINAGHVMCEDGWLQAIAARLENPDVGGDGHLSCLRYSEAGLGSQDNALGRATALLAVSVDPVVAPLVRRAVIPAFAR